METLRQVEKVLAISIFEICVHLLGLSISSVLLAIRLDADQRHEQSMKWFWVFSPLFCADMICAHYLVVVAVRMYLNRKYTRIAPIIRLGWSFMILSMLVLFKMLLSQRLDGNEKVNYLQISLPLIGIVYIYYVRTCQQYMYGIL